MNIEYGVYQFRATAISSEKETVVWYSTYYYLRDSTEEKIKRKEFIQEMIKLGFTNIDNITYRRMNSITKNKIS